MTSLFNQPLWQFALLALIFVGTVAGIYFLIDFFSRRVDVRRQLERFGEFTAAGSAGNVPADRIIGRSKETAFTRLIDLVEKSGLSLSDSQPNALRKKLVAAGYESPDAPRIYTFIRLALIFILPACFVIFLVISGEELTLLNLYVFGSICAFMGLLMPAWIVRIQADRRHEAITNGFPNCLDLMLVCVEAGLGMEAALDRVGRELADADPIVAGLLVRTTQHLRAGASREEALRRLAEYAGVSEVRSFCTLLIQSEKLGTSIATTLRVFAHEMRERRRLRAEEKAHRLPVLISIPLVVCMLPTMTGVLMLPAIIRVLRQLLPAMGA